MKLTRTGIGATFAAAVALGAAIYASGQQPPRPGMMGGNFQAMMQRRQQMMAQQNARLDHLVAIMDRAHGSAKVDAIAAVVKQLVADRKGMMGGMGRPMGGMGMRPGR